MVQAAGVAAPLVRLEPDSLRQQARRAIRVRVMTGAIAAGRLYTVANFASQLGVSPTPVREALLDLANEGLIEVVRNRGFRVVELSEKDLDDLIQLRMMLEVPAVADIAGRIGAEEMVEFRRSEQEIEQHAASGDWINFSEADLRFHLGLLGAFGNKHLVDLVRRLRDQTRVYVVPGLVRVGELEQSALEHRFILDAIESGDHAAVRTLMTRHLEHSRSGAHARRLSLDGRTAEETA